MCRSGVVHSVVHSVEHSVVHSVEHSEVHSVEHSVVHSVVLTNNLNGPVLPPQCKTSTANMCCYKNSYKNSYHNEDDVMEELQSWCGADCG